MIVIVVIIIIIIMVIIIDNIIAQGGEQVRLQDWRWHRPGLPEESAGVRIFLFSSILSYQIIIHDCHLRFFIYFI